MDKPKVFIDGREGTTGLQLWERLSRRTDLELLRIGEARRKDPAERKKYLNAADLVFLCLPDAAAWEAVGLIENGHTRIIDASTAHRTASGWVYGFPELYKDPERIIGQARRVANPGCHATGFLASAAPLSALHILLRDCPLTCFSLTGYSGGGRKMIAQYEAPDKPAELFSPRLYGTGLRHKHLTEMQKVAGLEQPPVFCPVVDDYYKGMATTVAIHMSQLRGVFTLRGVWKAFSDYYAGQKLVHVAADPTGKDEYIDAGSKIYGGAKAGDNDLSIVVVGNDQQLTITALFDNLGKGASGAAVQNMNLMLGFEETAGLV